MVDTDVASARSIGGTPRRVAGRVRRWLRPRRRWCWGTRLVVTGTAGWVTFLVLHLLLSGRTWLWSPVDLLPPLLFVVAPAAVLAAAPLARPVRWRVIPVLAATLVLGAGTGGLNPAALWHRPPPAPAVAVTVASWHVGPTGGGGDWSALHRALRDLDADVYLLAGHRPDGGAGTLPVSRLRRAFPQHTVVAAGDTVTLSRLPVVAESALAPAGAAAPPGAAAALRADLAVAGRVVSFYNPRLPRPGLGPLSLRGGARAADRAAHDRRAAGLAALRTDVAANPHPVVLAGDLAVTPTAGARRSLPNQLVDRTPALSGVYPASWPAGRWPLWRLDWLYTTRDVTVHRYELVAGAAHSAHRAQRTVVSVEGEPAPR